MNNEYLSKLLQRINYGLVAQFDREKLLEHKFIPVVLNPQGMYVVLSQDGSKENVSNYVKEAKKVNHTEFISVTPANFEALYAEVLKVLDKKQSGGDAAPEAEESKFQKQAALAQIQIKDQNAQANKQALQAELQAKVSSQSIGRPGDIAQVKAPQTKKIGEILVEEKLLTEKQVEQALMESKKMGLPLGSTLVKLGYITIKQLKDALAAQMNVEMVSEAQLTATPNTTSCLSDDFVREHKVLPLAYNQKTLTVGMVNPKDTATISQIIGMTGLKPVVMMITQLEYEKYIQTYYGGQGSSSQGSAPSKPQGGSFYGGGSNKKSGLEALNEEIAGGGSQGNAAQTLWDKVQSDIDDISSDAAKYANMIVTQAIDSRASDIHIEPRLDGYVTRYRIDGTLVEVVKIPASVEASIVSRFKVLAKMNIAEHRRPQDGNFTIKYNDKSYDFRINTLPVNGREKIVIRILAPSMKAEESYIKEIKIDGAFPDDIEKMKFLMSAPNGIVLTSGPTGSGKTTTQYALLKTMNSPEVNITTIEDPIEIRLDGVNQSAVNPKAGITFATCMRAILRQDPDVILVGEVRDLETLEVAISASLTGHFVLSTIHTNSAAATVTRLVEMGAKEYLVASTLTGVVAQRLVKRLCPECKQQYHITEDEARKITTDPEKIKQLTEMPLYRATGCAACNHTGYKGRLALLEVLIVTKEIKKLIASHAHEIDIEDCAVKGGMRTLNEACIKHIMEGNTTIDEFVRVLGLVGE